MFQTQILMEIFQIDLSNTYVLNRMFKNSDFTGDISNWDVSNVLYMEELFMWMMVLVIYLDGMFQVLNT